ncbi:MAG TPA: cytochrome P450 [Candidatus Limnocylindrales bacterium]|nr:cytochrome P450 [Candidatus Limnocylindrales bacterium]
MTTVAFDPTELEHVEDPYPIFARIREGGAVRRLETGFWMITGHAAALEALHHPECRSSPIAMRYLDGLPPGAARDEMSHRINFLDPPDHPRVRGIVSKAFTPRRIATLRPWIEQTAIRLLQALDGREEVDLLREFAHQVPSLVISELLGVPVEDRDRLTAWSDEVAPLLALQVSPEQKERAIAAAEDFHAYLGALLDDRARRPGEDLLSALLAAEAEGERLSRVELLSLAATLYSAGHRTTRDLFTNGMSVLLSDPQRYRRVLDGTWTIAATVEEFLRFQTPTLFVVRIPFSAVTIGGVEIGPYEPLLIFLAAANRDPAAYEQPEDFRPGRGGPSPLSFAFGAHFCLGASLARSEAEAMLAAVTSHWPNLRLAPDRALRWHQRGPFRGLDDLVVAA